MIVTSCEGVAPQGVLTTDPYITIQVEFPLDGMMVRQFSCYYRSTENRAHQSSEEQRFTSAMLEVVVERDRGRLCRLVLVSAMSIRYQDVDPGMLVVGDPVFDVDSTLGDRFSGRDRVRRETGYGPFLNQYEQYEILIGDHRVTLLFDGHEKETAILVGDHLIVFIDRDREVCGFQFIGLTDAQMEEVVDTIVFQANAVAEYEASRNPQETA